MMLKERVVKDAIKSQQLLIIEVGSVAMGASNYDPREAEVARAMCAQADQVYMLADFSKLGVSSRISTCAAGDIDLLISNRQAAAMPACQQLAARIGELWLV